MSIFEAIMLICFAASWPTAIFKTVRTKNPAGKSLGFAALVLIGYLAGIVHKLQRPDWVISLYILNALMVGTDLILVIYYTRKNAREAALQTKL